MLEIIIMEIILINIIIKLYKINFEFILIDWKMLLVN